MKKASCLIVVSLFVLLSGCSREYACKCINPCVFPGTDSVAAPMWVCGTQLEGFKVSAVGSASSDMAAGGVRYMYLVAVEDARTQLAHPMQELAGNAVKKYFETATTTVDPGVIDKIKVSLAQYITAKTLIGEKSLRRKVGPIGTMYVLVGMTSESVEQTIQKAIQTSMKNEPGLWLNLSSKNDLDALVVEIVLLVH